MQWEINGKTVFANVVGATNSSAPIKIDDPSTCVFIHGAGQDHRVWQDVQIHLAGHAIPSLAIDLPGHGQSEGPYLESIEAMADLMSRFLQTTVDRPLSVIGHSMGSLVTLSLAARYPHLVRRIALIATAIPMSVHPNLLELTADNDKAAIDRIVQWSFSRPEPSSENAATPFQLRRQQRITVAKTRYRQWMQACQPGLIHADLTACDSYTTGLADASRVSCPSLIVLGQRDVMTPVKNTESLRHALPNCETVIVPNAGHALLAECDERVAKELAKFISS